MDIRRTLTMLLLFGLSLIAVQYVTALWTGKDKAKDAPATAPSVMSAPASQPLAAEQNAPPQKILIGNPERSTINGIHPTKLALTVNTITAGIDLVQLNVNDYAETTARQEPLRLLAAQPDVPKPYATLGVHITIGGSIEELPLGGKPTDYPAFDPDPLKNAPRAKIIHDLNSSALYQSQYVWKVARQTPDELDLLLTIQNEKGESIARIIKTFVIDPASYDVLVSHRVENLSNQPLHVEIDEMAATDLPQQSTNAARDDRVYHAAAIDVDKKIIDADRFNAAHLELAKMKDPTRPIGQLSDYSASKDPFVWIASSNRFFTAITRPLPHDAASIYTLTTGVIPMPRHVASADIDVLFHSSVPNDCISGIRLTGAPIDVAPHTAASLPLAVFFGPKDRNLLRGKEGAPIGTVAYNYDIFKYSHVIQYNTTSCFVYNACPIDFLAQTLLWLLDALARTIAFHNYGIAIIILVVLIRAILHPLTRSSQVSMATMGKKMNTIKPLIEASKKRYPDDRKKQGEEQMRIYKENDVNPAASMLGCLPMLIQMPIWVAMYSGLWADLDLRHAVFIPGWINDLASPDSVLTFHPITIPLLSSLMGPIGSLNLLPILLAVVFFFQMKVQMASQPKPADEQQAQMQSMSKYMFFIVPLFLYSAPAGLNLYYFASTMAGLVDTYFVRKTLKKRGILPADAETLPTHEQS